MPLFQHLDLYNITFYFLFIVLLIFLIWIERKDVACPTLTSTKKECEMYGGMSFSYTRPNDNDSCDTLFKKIWKASGAEQSSIKWRRCFILSSIIVFLVYFFVATPGTIPDYKTFFLSFVIVFALLMMCFIYYSYHVYAIPEYWIKDSIKLLSKKCHCNIHNTNTNNQTTDFNFFKG